MHSTTEVIESADGPMGVHIVRPDGDGPFPVIVFFHHGPGLDDGSKKTMARIAEWGYYVISHDRYHRAEPWFHLGSEPDAMKRMFDVLLATSEDMVASDLDAVLTHVSSDRAAAAGAKGCIGYCIGARSVLRTIGDRGDEFRAGVGLHPSFCTTDEPGSPHLVVAPYTGSLYIGFGADDTMQPASANMPLIDDTNALAKGEAEIHEGANHGFGVYGGQYHDAAATRSYERAKAMFDRELRPTAH